MAGITGNTVDIDFLIDTAIDNADMFVKRVPTVTKVEYQLGSKVVLVEWNDILNEESILQEAHAMADGSVLLSWNQCSKHGRYTAVTECNCKFRWQHYS